jgi:uncharacterized protein involved in exopolysaccharide biosynthesis
MPDSFHPLDYIHYLGRRWKLWTLALVAAGLTAALACLVLPKRYTATAMIVIDPPAASDPRAGIAVTPTYLESLRSYEEFASSQSLFLRACRKFHLLEAAGSPAFETFQRRVLRVDKLKDTRLLQISVTLRDPKLAQAVAQYVAEQTVALNQRIAGENDASLLAAGQRQLDMAREALAAVRDQAARIASEHEAALDEEISTHSEVLRRTEQQLADANATAAELTAQQRAIGAATPASDREYLRQQLAGAQARQAALAKDKQAMQTSLDADLAALAKWRARRQDAYDQLSRAESAFDLAQQHASNLAASAGSRSEQLRVVDPGIVPQRPSFPNLPLALAAALLLSGMASLAWLTLQFGLSRQREHPVRAELRVAHGAR